MGGIFVTKRIQALQKKEYRYFHIYLWGGVSENSAEILSIIRAYTASSQNQFAISWILSISAADVKMGFVSMAAASFCPVFYEHRITKMLERDSKGGKRADIIHLHWVWPVGIGVQKFCQKERFLMSLPAMGVKLILRWQNRESKKKAMVQVLEKRSSRRVYCK